MLAYGKEERERVNSERIAEDMRDARRDMAQGGKRWADPVLTGDAVADEWEKAIARGEVPDLDAKPARSRRATR